MVGAALGAAMWDSLRTTSLFDVFANPRFERAEQASWLGLAAIVVVVLALLSGEIRFRVRRRRGTLPQPVYSIMPMDHLESYRRSFLQPQPLQPPREALSREQRELRRVAAASLTRQISQPTSRPDSADDQRR